MLKFDMANGVAVIDGLHLKAIPEFEELYEKLDPITRDRVFTYIHILSKVDKSAPFFTAPEHELLDLIHRQYFRDVVFPEEHSELIEKALEKYTIAYESAESRILKLFNDKIDSIARMVKNIEPKIVEYVTNAGSKGFASNVDMITKSLKEIDTLRTTKEKLEAKLKGDAEKQGAARGGKRPSRLERKSMVKKSENSDSK